MAIFFVVAGLALGLDFGRALATGAYDEVPQSTPSLVEPEIRYSGRVVASESTPSPTISDSNKSCEASIELLLSLVRNTCAFMLS